MRVAVLEINTFPGRQAAPLCLAAPGPQASAGWTDAAELLTGPAATASPLLHDRRGLGLPVSRVLAGGAPGEVLLMDGLLVRSPSRRRLLTPFCLHLGSESGAGGSRAGWGAGGGSMKPGGDPAQQVVM